MIRFIFKMVLVERGQEALWRGRANPGGGRRDVGRCELIEAHDIQEAVETASRQYPDLTVMREGCERICSA